MVPLRYGTLPRLLHQQPGAAMGSPEDGEQWVSKYGLQLDVQQGRRNGEAHFPLGLSLQYFSLASDQPAGH